MSPDSTGRLRNTPSHELKKNVGLVPDAEKGTSFQACITWFSQQQPLSVGLERLRQQLDSAEELVRYKALNIEDFTQLIVA